MNVDNQTILHVKAGQVPETKLVELILAKKPTAFGFAVQGKADDGTPEMDVVRENGDNLTLDTVQSFLQQRKEFATTLYFANLPKGYDADDVQPFIISDPDDKTFMTLFVEGDIIGNAEPKAHTEHYNLINGVIIPKIVEWCEDFEGDLDKVMKKINGEVFNKDWLTHVGHRAILHILPMAGDSVMLGKNELGLEADWGWVSQRHGFGDAVQEPVAAEPVKKKGWWGGKKPAASTEKVETKPVEPPPLPKDVATRGEGPKPSVPDVTVKPAEGDKPIEVAVRPPSWLHKNDHVKAFYSILTGQVPGNWKKRIPCVVKQNETLLQCTNLEQFEKWRLDHMMSTTSAKAPQTKAERIAAEQPAPEAPAQDAPIHGPTDPAPLPIIEPKDLEKVLDYVAKHLDGQSKEIPDPKEMQSIEAQLPKFSDAVGVKLEEMLNWPVSGLFGLAATDPRAMVLYALQWRAYARPILQAELRAKEKTSTKTVETDLGNGSKKVESVAAPAPKTEAAPSKKSWGNWGKKAA